MKDRYVECLVEFYARHKIEDRQMRQLFSEHVDELRHCYKASAEAGEERLRE